MVYIILHFRSGLQAFLAFLLLFFRKFMNCPANSLPKRADFAHKPPHWAQESLHQFVFCAENLHAPAYPRLPQTECIHQCAEPFAQEAEVLHVAIVEREQS
ncbi:MAG: hypothetical protein LBN05_04120 [Oscillospiraceae bacterium]|nr:hypothetical protein [Oscillospiraceae bacterium]